MGHYRRRRARRGRAGTGRPRRSSAGSGRAGHGRFSPRDRGSSPWAKRGRRRPRWSPSAEGAWSSDRTYTSRCSCRCALAILPRPMVRAPPNVAGSGPRGSSSSGPASGHVRCHRSSVPTALDSTSTGFQYHGVDTASQPRLDCRLGRLVPHHTSCWHPFFRPTPTSLLSFIYHSRQWLLSSGHLRGYRFRSFPNP